VTDPGTTDGLPQEQQRGHAVRGGTLLAAGAIVERVARLGRNMVLARLIAPDQFGVMAIVLAVIALFEAITEVGVAQAVIQNKSGDTPEFLNVAWWFGLARGLILLAIALPLAPLVASMYDMPELTNLLLVAPLTTVFAGATSPRIYALQRQFRFGATLWTTQGAGLIATAATIVLGFQLQNVWALMLGTVFESFTRFVLSFAICPIRPSIHLDPVARRQLLRFSRGMAGLSLLTFVVMQADTFVLGRVVTAEELGLYTMAISLAAFPLMVFSKVVQPLVVPVFAEVQDRLPELRAQLLQLSRLVWLFGLPLATIMTSCATPILTLVYGRPEFARVAPAFSLYSYFVVVYMASMVSFSVYLAIGRPERQRVVTVVRAGVVLGLMYPLSLWLGSTGAALSLLIALVTAMLIQLFNLRRVIGQPILAYLVAMRGGVIASAVIAVPAFASAAFLNLGTNVDLAAGLALGCATWGWLALRERRALQRLGRGDAAAESERTAPNPSSERDTPWP